MPARVIQSAALVKDSELFSVRLQAAGFLIAVWLLMSSLLLLAPDESSLKSNSQTPLGLLGLQLAPDAQSAATMLGHWRTPATLLETAERATIEDSTSYIRLYVLVLFLCGTLVYVLLARNHEPNQDSDRVYFWFWLAGLTCLIFAALCDGMIENPHLLQLIQQAQRLPESPPDFPHPEFVEQVRRVLPTIRLAAQVKFGLLAIVIGAIVAGSGGVARRWVNDCRWRVIDSRKRRQLAPADYEACSVPGDFRALDQQERRLLQECESCHPDDIGTWQTEPWIKNLNTDRVGLALSGGGIRSATFNLGLLQSLAQLQVLPLVDYLSTVSGGGYIGGWLSAWRLRLQQQSPETVAQSAYGPAGLFPSADGPLKFALPPAEHPNPPRREPETRPEAEEIRHLREFSSFLAPRWGFLEIETWNAVIAILVGLTPTLILAITCLLLFQILWVATTAHLSYPFPWLLTLETALPVAVALVAGEKLWSRRHPG
ncbi:MAG: hypothetical protein JSS02_02500, partial [Planctomycetes bacterium]|nr:hypothetical protein [Planctomycetota bacterium]